MLESVRDEFDRRSAEIDTLYSHILVLDEQVSREVGENGAALISILSSSLYLMLYNQVESTAFSCVESIYDSIHEKRVSFNKLVPEFKKKIISDLRQSYHGNESIMVNMRSGDISEVIAKTSLKLEKVFNGNVDAKKIRTVLGCYKIKVTSPSPGNSGEELVGLKASRNSLAHGSSSFEKHGRLLAVSDLNRMRDHIREYMSHVITLTENYLLDEAYLDPVCVA